MTSSTDYTASGTFWIAGAPEKSRDGTLQIKDQAITAEVVGELTPAFVPLAGSSALVQNSDEDTEMVIHGSLSKKPGRVTIMDVRSQGRYTLYGAGQGAKSTQLMAGEYCIFDAHIPAKDSTFRAARIRLDCLEEWAVFQGLNTQLNMEKQSYDINSNLPESSTLDVSGPNGTIMLIPAHSYKLPTVRGAGVETKVWLEWRPSEEWDFTRMLVEFVYPIQALFTVLFDRPATVDQYEVRYAENQTWLPVHGNGIGIGPSSSPNEAAASIVTRADCGLELLAGWLRISHQLSPVPQILASTITSQAPSVNSEVLNLCTAAEGLHRRLFPDACRLSDSDVEATVAVIRATRFPGNAGEILESAMLYLGEPSFPMRLVALAARIETAAPEITGKTSRWKQAVTSARHGNAHSLENGTSPVAEAETYYALAKSLHWLLKVSLLLEAGVPEASLRSGLSTYRPFANFIFMSRKFAPKIFEDQANQDSIRN